MTQVVGHHHAKKGYPRSQFCAGTSPCKGGELCRGGPKRNFEVRSSRAVAQTLTYDAGMAPGKSFPKAQYSPWLSHTPPWASQKHLAGHKGRQLR